MKIKIKTVTIDQYVNLHDAATVRDLKNTIEEIFGVSLSEQTLRFNLSNLNDNNKLLADYEIRDGSEINLIVHFSQFNVLVSIPSESLFRIKMSATNRISKLKLKIQAAKKIPFIEQVILYKGKVTEDFKSLADYGISEGSIVCVIPQKRSSDKSIILQMVNGNTHTIHLVGTDDVQELKQKIFDEFGIEKRDQILKFKNRTINDNDKFSDIGIKDAFTEITLRRDIKIFSKSQHGVTEAFKVIEDETVQNVKIKIRNILKLPADELKLVFQGGILADDKTIDEYQIIDNSTIHVEILKNHMQILARTLDGKTFSIEVKRNEKISDLKIKIQEKIGLHPNEQKLIFQGKLIEDERVVEEYGINEKSVIGVVARLKG